MGHYGFLPLIFVEVEQSDRPKTVFTVGPLGLYECNCMPFGLTNSRSDVEMIGDLNL